MSKLLQNTGAKSYVGRYTYGQTVFLNQKLLVRDNDAAALLVLTTKSAAGATVPVFTLLTSGIADIDVTGKYQTGTPLTIGEADTPSQVSSAQLPAVKSLVGSNGKWSLGRPARAIWVGNSLVDSFGGYSENLGYWGPQGHITNTLFSAGMAIDMRNRLSTALDVNYWDRWGNVGHGGARLDGITNDILVGGLLAQMATDGVPPPDIVVLAGGLENDIGTDGVSTATAKQRIDRYLQTVESLWPGVRHLLWTPWPSAFYDTAAKRATADYVRAYVLSLEQQYDNIAALDISRLHAADDWQPYAGLTDGIHPAVTTYTVPQRIGKACGKKLRTLLGSRASWGKPIQTSNPGMTGSIAAGTAGANGTAPTGGTFTNNAPSGGTIVSVAEQPGWTITYGNTDGAAGKDYGDFSLAGIVPSDLTKVDPVISLVVESGAANLIGMTIRARMMYTDASNDFKIITSTAGTFIDAEWVDGDTIEMVAPRLLPTSGKTLQTMSLYIKPSLKGQAGSVRLRIKTLGAL